MRIKHPREWAAPLAALCILVGGVFVATVYVGGIHGLDVGDLRIPVWPGARHSLGEKIPGGPQADTAVVDEGHPARVPAAAFFVTGTPASAAPGHSAVTAATEGPIDVVMTTRDVSGEPPIVSNPTLPALSTLPALGVPVPVSHRVNLPTVSSIPRPTTALRVGDTVKRFDDATPSSSTVYRSDLIGAAAYAGSSTLSRSKSSPPTSSAVRQDGSVDHSGSAGHKSVSVASAGGSSSAQRPVASSASGSHHGGAGATKQAVRHPAPKSTAATSDSRVGRAGPRVGNKSSSARAASKPKASVSRTGSRVHVSPSRSVPTVQVSRSRVRSGRGTTYQPAKAPSSSHRESRVSSRSGGKRR